MIVVVIIQTPMFSKINIIPIRRPTSHAWSEQLSHYGFWVYGLIESNPTTPSEVRISNSKGKERPSLQHLTSYGLQSRHC